MNKLYKILFVILFLTSACKGNDINKNVINQVINNIDMNIYSNNGKKLFSIKSPYSKYEINGNIFNLKETTIHLFNNKNNKVEYIINSEKSKLTNNELIELNGNVRIKNIHERNDKLNADSISWNTQNSNYFLNGNVIFQNNTILLSSNKAIFNKSNNIIEFFKPVKYIIKDDYKETRYEINSENAYYNTNTKTISFSSKDERVRSKLYY